MRILVDYRAALRARTGVGEYIHALVRAYATATSDTVEVFTSSWKDRPDPGLAQDLGARVIDRRVPVRVLNLLWHRLEWPAVETLTRTRPDVVHAAHPLLIPSRTAAQVVTIHDLFFLDHAERTEREIRRDYPALAPSHVRRADAVITSSRHTASLLTARLDVPADHIYVCPPGRPVWRTLGREPNVPASGCILFLGTLEPRKNVATLLDAYERLLARTDPPRLVLAGRAGDEAAPWLRRLSTAPLQGRAVHLGYVADEERETLLAGARLLVLPSFDEGFGLPVLEAMSAGVPVVASNRGSLPEVLAGAGVLVDPGNAEALADAIARMVTDDQWAIEHAAAGLARARSFTWDASAATLQQAYRDAVVRRQNR